MSALLHCTGELGTFYNIPGQTLFCRGLLALAGRRGVACLGRRRWLLRLRGRAGQAGESGGRTLVSTTVAAGNVMSP